MRALRKAWSARLRRGYRLGKRCIQPCCGTALVTVIDRNRPQHLVWTRPAGSSDTGVGSILDKAIMASSPTPGTPLILGPFCGGLPKFSFLSITVPIFFDDVASTVRRGSGPFRMSPDLDRANSSLRDGRTASWDLSPAFPNSRRIRKLPEHDANTTPPGPRGSR